MASIDTSNVTVDSYGKRSVKYPSPYFNLAENYMPVTVKEMFRWCRYYYFKHPLVSSVINKLAEFPIMDLQYTTENQEQQEWWKELLEDVMNFRSFAIGIGLDYLTYGNAFFSINVPVVKRLKCECGEDMPLKDWKWKGYKFEKICPKCGKAGPKQVIELKSKNRFDYNFVRWDPSNIDIDFNPITGKSTYYYQIPNKLLRDITEGRPEVVENVPQYYIDAIREEKRIQFSPQNFYHFKRETLAERDQEWGKSIIFPVLTTIFYMQVLTRSQEAIAVQHIVPLWILFPQATPTMDPYTTINLDSWRIKIESELTKWKRDPNHIPVMPMPVGNSIIGGEGRGLLLGQEIQMLCQNILAGMGVPQEFIYGGMTYTGTSVTLRMLENQLIGFSTGIQKVLRRFIVPFLSKCLDKDPMDIKMASFRMADDIQRKNIIMQLNQGGKISDQTMLSEIDVTMDYKKELKLRSAEMNDNMNLSKRQNLANAEIQGETQIVNASYAAEAQKVSQVKGMQAQKEIMEDLQAKAQNGDQFAAMQLQQMMGPPPGQDPNAQGGQPAQGDPNAQGQPQGDPNAQGGDPNMIIQLALMPPEQLQQMVDQGQIDPNAAQFAQQIAQMAQQATPDQIQQALQAGQIDEQTAQVVMAVQQQMGQGQNGQPMTGQNGQPGQQDQMAVDAFNQANPGMNSEQYANLIITYAKQLDRMPKEFKKQMISNMQQSSPQLYEAIIGTYNNILKMRSQGASNSQIDQALQQSNS